MDQVELAVDPGPLGQLEHAAELDFDADGFDFQLDGVYDQADDNQQDAPTVTTESAVSQVDEIGYEDDEEDIQLGNAAPNLAETDGPVEDLVGDETVEAGREYQEEIGYEEDYSLTTEAVNVDENFKELIATDLDQPEHQAEDQLAPHHEDSSDQAQTHGQGDQVVSQENLESEKPYVEEEPHHQLDDDDDDEKENVPELDNHSDMDNDDESNHAADHEDYPMDQDEEPRTGLSELDRAIEDLASSLHAVSDVEVFYNDVNYSLFGTSDDDPESYFLSDIKKLDEPLAQFLSSLRHVIANEIAPTDTLLVSFDSLDLEFGERSSGRFLNRTLRELLDCYAALAAKDSAISSVPVLQLIIQHDCEERFQQLLDEAKYGGELSHHSEHSQSENPDEWPAGDFEGGEQDEMVHVGYENELLVNDVVASNEESHDSGVSLVAQIGDEYTLETGAQNGDAAENEEAATPSAHSPIPEVISEEQSNHDGQSVHQENIEAMDAEDYQPPPDFPQEQVSFETVNDHIDEQEMKDADEEFDVITELETTEEGHITSNGVLEQTTGLNDDDLLLAFDQDGGLSTIDEQEGDDGQGDEISATVVPEVNANIPAESNEGGLGTDWQAETSQVLRGTTPATSEDSQHKPSAVAAGDAASDHTSTTINGDEIDYEENDAADDSFTPDNSAPHSVVAPVEDGDEIDWGNDGDEYEEEHNGMEGDITFEAQPDLELIPLSPTGKRYRTDDAESLAEESDHKRRRT